MAYNESKDNQDEQTDNELYYTFASSSWITALVSEAASVSNSSGQKLQFNESCLITRFVSQGSQSVILSHYQNEHAADRGSRANWRQHMCQTGSFFMIRTTSVRISVTSMGPLARPSSPPPPTPLTVTHLIVPPPLPRTQDWNRTLATLTPPLPPFISNVGNDQW